MPYLVFALLLVIFTQSSCAYADELRLGYMPNLTHAQAMVIFERGKPDNIQAISFNSGPGIVDAIYMDRIDMAYIGPNPAINGYLKSKGKAFVIVSGATSGGAVLVMKNGKKLDNNSVIAAPSMGNTQDVALRHYLKEHNLNPKIIDIPNREIFQLFKGGKIDGAWVPEPWGTILIKEKGYILIDERELWDDGTFPTTVLIVSKKYLENHREEVKKFIKLHVETTDWINAHPTETVDILTKQISKITKKKMPKDTLKSAYSRMRSTYDPMEKQLDLTATHAYELGFLGVNPYDISNIYDLTLLNEILTQKGAKK